MATPDPIREQSLERSLRLSERLVADFPDVPLYRDALATTANQYGVLLDILSRPADAERESMLALAQQPDNPQALAFLALSRVEQGKGRAALTSAL